MANTEVGQLKKKILIEGTITAVTGLHIGGSNVGLSIGGADATVVRNPLTNQPYIPGSSLKGKMRSLLEKLEGVFEDAKMGNVKYGPYTAYGTVPAANIIIDIFGTTPEKLEKAGKLAPPSRLIVRDCPLTEESAALLLNMKTTDMPFTEVKTEVVIDRITAKAMPRQLERVPAGTEFEMSMILNIHNDTIDQSEATMVYKLFQALILVQNDYLGGKGTRGSGQVDIKITSLHYKTADHYRANETWQDLDGITIPKELKPEVKHDNKPL